MQQYGFPPSQPAIWGVVAMQIALGKRDVSRHSYRIYHRHQRYLIKQAVQAWVMATTYGSAMQVFSADGTIKTIHPSEYLHG